MKKRGMDGRLLQTKARPKSIDEKFDGIFYYYIHVIITGPGIKSHYIAAAIFWSQ